MSNGEIKVINDEQMQMLWDRFRRRIKGFESFENPGADFEANELSYKRKALARYQSELGNEQVRKLVEEGRSQEVVKSIDKLLTTNIVSFHSWRKTLGDSNEKSANVLRSFLTVAEQEFTGPETVEPIFTAISDEGLTPTWDAISTLLWAMRPEDYFPVKITYFRELADELGYEITPGSPTAESFAAMRGLGDLIRRNLDHQPKDWIDVQSFMWVVCPKKEPPARYTWIPIYKKIAEAVLQFRSDQRSLINMLQAIADEGLPMLSLNDKEADDPKSPFVPLEVMDPFTFFAAFNRSATHENRRQIIRRIQSCLDLEEDVPSDFDGIPTANPRRSWFFGYLYDRKEGDIDALWDLAEQVVHGTPATINKESFDRCVKIWGIGKSNLTMGCFWLNPENFLSVDSKNEKYLSEVHGIPLDFNDFAAYCNLLRRVHDNISDPFPEISYKADEYAKKNEGETPEHARAWLYAPGENARLWNEFFEQGIMGLGWDKLGDYRQVDSRDEMEKRLVESYGYDKKPSNDGKTCFDFVKTVKPGDVVYAKRGLGEIVGCGEVLSDCLYDESRKEYRHYRKVKWTKSGSWTIGAGSKLPLKTLTDITHNHALIERIESLWESKEKSCWIFQANPEVYDLREALKALDEIDWTVNQSKDLIRKGDSVYLWESGSEGGILATATVLTDPCDLPLRAEESEFIKSGGDLNETKLRVRLSIDKVLKSEITRAMLLGDEILKSLSILKNPQGTNFFVTPEQAQALERLIDGVFPPVEYLLQEMSEETGVSVDQLLQWRGSLERKGQCVFYGPPGTGKTYIAERMARHLIGGGDGFVDLVQFHPAYSYEDFIQGIRPQTRDDGGLEYLLVPGQFLKFCQKAKKCEGTCVLIIDEINRANLAKVFGELMYLLEYRDKKIPLASGNMLEIPSNVRIIGTMNTADRSIALVDHALRRRFAFLALYPDYDVLRKFHSGNGFNVDGLISTLKTLNAQIDDRHYQVGISFFLREDLNNTIEDIWRVEIEPYVEEFFFDRPNLAEDFRWEQIKNSILGE